MMEAARQAKAIATAKVDNTLYDLICEKPGSSIYDLAKSLSWSTGKVHGSIIRLKKDNWVHIDREVKNGRYITKITAIPYHEAKLYQ